MPVKFSYFPAYCWYMLPNTEILGKGCCIATSALLVLALYMFFSTNFKLFLSLKIAKILQYSVWGAPQTP